MKDIAKVVVVFSAAQWLVVRHKEARTWLVATVVVFGLLSWFRYEVTPLGARTALVLDHWTGQVDAIGGTQRFTVREGKQP